MRISVVISSVIVGILGFVAGKLGNAEWFNRVSVAFFAVGLALVTLAIYFAVKSRRLTNKIRTARGGN